MPYMMEKLTQDMADKAWSIIQEIEAMETPETHTLRIHLKTPNTLFPQNIAEPVAVIFPREVLEEDGDLKKRLIGTGPYILKEWSPDQRIVFTINPNWWDKNGSNIRDVIYTPIKSDATRVAALLSGDVDMVTDLPTQDVDRLHAAGSERPHLPVIAEPLQLAVATNADAPARL